MRKLVFFLIPALLLSSKAHSSCWTDIVPGQYGKILHCAFEDWKNRPDRKNTLQLLNDLYYVYFTDGTDKSMKSFFDGLRQGSPDFLSATTVKSQLIERYRPIYPSKIETPALPMMPQTDALALFVLSQTDAQSIPLPIAEATYLTVYRHAEVLFALGLATSNQFGILPPGEYTRMLEIVKRMSWISDPYMKAMNHYFQAVLYFNRKDAIQGKSWMILAAAEFQHCLETSQETLSKKRILMRLADVHTVLQDWEKAEEAYVSILKMDPQDWDALLGLSKLLYRNGKCEEPGVWVEASIQSNQERFELTIHCGNREFHEEEPEREEPVLAWSGSYGGQRDGFVFGTVYRAIACNSKSH
jgi:tetratricopeptide (TPR) repeat protein